MQGWTPPLLLIFGLAALCTGDPITDYGVPPYTVTINVPVVYVALNVMILMRANPLQGPLEGVDPENRDIFWP
jgi:hypothetical protein